MRFPIFAAIAAALLVSAGPVQASPASEAYDRYASALDQASDDMDAAAENGDKYAGCRAMERAMTNARYAANAIVDLIDETKTDDSLGPQERAELLQSYRDAWDQYDNLAKSVSNAMDVCSGINYR